ncbi:Histidine kinase-like ATPase [Clostridium acetobutylicum EA 2018]|uniref:GHKL domain-containing protein n=1 Tax=Clostridium acetobutylicum TaxID=1488 RepID=UPI000200A772|nr:GHKL domain-containing protein [Clostridium acetobutylicum]ADZ19124.1 Histidine kinase-like ATPase [Clostridium acetobutylicum EA 2018]
MRKFHQIYKIYKRGFSTKGDNRGIGLSNLKDIIGKYPNVMLDTVIEDNQFKQIIDIKNKIEEGVFNA